MSVSCGPWLRITNHIVVFVSGNGTRLFMEDCSSVTQPIEYQYVTWSMTQQLYGLICGHTHWSQSVVIHLKEVGWDTQGHLAILDMGLLVLTIFFTHSVCLPSVSFIKLRPPLGTHVHTGMVSKPNGSNPRSQWQEVTMPDGEQKGNWVCNSVQGLSLTRLNY